MLSKLAECKNKWNRYLSDVEFVINNIINKSTGTSPDVLLFGVNQYDPSDHLRNCFNSSEQIDSNLDNIGCDASKNIEKSQDYNKT